MSARSGRRGWLRAVAAAGTVTAVTAGGALVSARAQDDPAKPPAQNGSDPEVVLDPKTIWQGGLSKLAGTYVFAQVASPGGLWERHVLPDGRAVRRQVSINEAPRAFREKLQAATIVISDLQEPTRVEASQRISPSKRGMLRFYEEEGLGKVTVRNLPGMNGVDGSLGNYSGPVVLRLDHQSHSNPSVSGVLMQRQQQETTWGTATLDFADLSAYPVPAAAPGQPAQPGALPEAPGKTAPSLPKGTPAAVKPGKPAPVKPGEPPKPPAGAEPHEEDEAPPVISNARTLRSGVEIFCFVEWKEQSKAGLKTWVGTVRLLRKELVPREDATPMPAPTPRKLEMS